ncbi:MAG: hypothetical protein PHO32_00545, partial [Candidatus Cloacimonetes bacterium]|nr:hypothetical protein [Candidatus Cloacimonadota bacterium]
MKTRVFIFLLLMMIMVISAIYASEDPTENEEYFRKKQELGILADRFKAETAFRGDIETYPDQMKLARFTGNFDDIDMTNVRDSVAFRQVCTNVINKLLPYIGANSEQLVLGKINVDSDQIDTRYYQKVNGYQIESGGYLNIYYLYSHKRFGILNVTVDIPQESLGNIISKEEAFSIARSAFEQTEYCNENTPKHRSRTTIIYRNRVLNGKSQPYRLYWKVAFPGLLYYIDAVTSEYYTERYVVNDVYTYSVDGKKYGVDTSFGLIGMKPVKGIEVCNGADPDYTNAVGEVQFPNLPDSSFQVTLSSEKFSISSGNNPDIIHVNSFTTIDSLNYETLLDDLIIQSDSTYSYFAPNIFHHIIEQDTLFCKLDSNFSTITYPNVINDCQNMSSALGEFDPQTYAIKLANGLNSHVVRHESSHFFTYQVMNYHQFYESASPINANLYQSMDEAFAEYWLSIGINSTTHNYGQPVDIQNVDVGVVYTSYNNYSLPLNEAFYSWYSNRYPIASAWWSLRNNSIFGSDPRPGVKAFDDILVKTLRQDVDPNYAQRYKPRYFYNLLMQRTADLLQPDVLNNKQKAINNAYNSRGLKFYPTVESYSGGNKGRNVYNMNDSVYVEISNCPQNTRINIYVIKHGNYTYTDGAPVSALNDHLANGFTQAIIATTNADGEWSSPTPIWIATEEGEYDIIVDIGSPGTPDGIIHFAFSGANVMDGIDGRTEAGFTVIENGIDVAVALDVSGSMLDVDDDIQRATRALIGYLDNGDRVNVFKFCSDGLSNYV